jgi:hypothetical protein
MLISYDTIEWLVRLLDNEIDQLSEYTVEHVTLFFSFGPVWIPRAGFGHDPRMVCHTTYIRWACHMRLSGIPRASFGHTTEQGNLYFDLTHTMLGCTDTQWRC